VTVAVTVSVAVVLALMQACGGGGAPRTFLSIGTGGTGGIYYPLGGALASRLSLADSMRQYTAEVTGGSVENVNRIREGQIDLGFALAVAAYGAYHGEGDFSRPDPELRVVAPLYPNLTHVMVPAGSDVRSLADLAGKRVSVGSAGSGTEQISRQLLEIYGLTYDDVEPRYLSFSESSAALRDGAIDAAILSVGYPAAAVLEAATTSGIRLVPIDAERAAALRARHPYYSAGEIPGGVYPGVDAPVPTVAMMNWIVGSSRLPDDVVTLVLNTLEGDRVSLEQVHDMAKQIDLGRLDEAPIPLHTAAEHWKQEHR